MNIQIDKNYLKGLRIAYNKAIKDGKDQFKYNGNDFIVGYAKYFLGYWEAQFGISFNPANN